MLATTQPHASVGGVKNETTERPNLILHPKDTPFVRQVGREIFAGAVKALDDLDIVMATLVMPASVTAEIQPGMGLRKVLLCRLEVYMDLRMLELEDESVLDDHDKVKNLPPLVTVRELMKKLGFPYGIVRSNRRRVCYSFWLAEQRGRLEVAPVRLVDVIAHNFRGADENEQP